MTQTIPFIGTDTDDKVGYPTSSNDANTGDKHGHSAPFNGTDTGDKHGYYESKRSSRDMSMNETFNTQNFDKTNEYESKNYYGENNAADDPVLFTDPVSGTHVYYAFMNLNLTIIMEK